jgi:putative PIN family toxin of toxin-antitoxin system
MLVVLDTNVWVDWLVFNDPSTAPVKAAQQEGSLHIAINAACFAELNAVLAYPEFSLGESQRHNHLAEVDRCTVRYDGLPAKPSTALPLCTDPDDQKFLSLAHAVSADWLLTRDKALLKLRRRLKAVGVRVGAPAEWFAEFTSAG